MRCQRRARHQKIQVEFLSQQNTAVSLPQHPMCLSVYTSQSLSPDVRKAPRKQSARPEVSECNQQGLSKVESRGDDTLKVHFMYYQEKERHSILDSSSEESQRQQRLDLTVIKNSSSNLQSQKSLEELAQLIQ